MNEHAAPSEQPSGINSEATPDRLDVQRWYRRIYAHCQSLLISTSDSEDAVQETFVRAISRFAELRTGAAVGGWLRQIAHNVCIDMIRRQQIRRTDPIDVQTVSTDRDRNLPAERDQREHLMRLINALPQSQREIILLHYYESLTYDEIATWLGIARSTVNDRLSRARQNLKAELATTRDAI